MCGYYEPTRHKIDLGVAGNTLVDKMNRMTDAELLKIIMSAGDSEPLSELQLLENPEDGP